MVLSVSFGFLVVSGFGVEWDDGGDGGGDDVCDDDKVG